MLFSCEKKVLIESVLTASRAVSNKSTIAVLEGLLLTAQSDGRINICGYNMSMGIMTFIGGVVDEPGSAVLNARLFGDIIRKLPEDLITIETNENMMTTITCGRAVFNLMASDPAEFPQMPEVENRENNITLPQSILKTMIAETIFAVSDNETKPALTGCLFETENEQITIAAVDGFRLSVRRETMQNPVNNDMKFIVPGSALREVERILSDNDEPAEIYPDPHHVLFRIGPTILISRLLEGEFLNYRAAIPTDSAYDIVVKVPDLISSIERVSLIISEKLKNPIRMEFEGSMLKISCITAIGKSYDEHSYEGNIDHLEIGFNNRYLLDALRAIPYEIAKVSLNGSLNPIVFTPLEGNAYTHLVLPVRLKAE